MSFPSSGPGYPPQGGGPNNPQGPGTGSFPPVGPPPQQQQLQAGALNFAVILALAVSVLGLVQYFVGFSDEASPAGESTTWFLVGGLLAALRVLPNAPKVLPFAALISVLGALQALDHVIAYGENDTVPGIITVIVILGFLQLLAAVAALLFDYDVLKLPAPKPQGGPQQYGPPSGQQPAQPQPGQPGQYAPQQPQFGGPPPASSPQQTTQYAPTGGGNAPDSGGFSQPTQYSTPVTPPSTPGQQPTSYAPQQGQFFQQQQQQQSSGSGSESGSQQQSPGTPPGGFGKPGS
ncbi:DUF5336 domain-containing protein [Amycolatopsis albispora]|uniref:34 kDa antigenic protein n=1 Tax=Amycolatopsis albispora TaxID=1804986 RepID=A0A344LFV2_9PSEU|nr:DUF5336 domain-containing protein [Amycolatopsis albispora]AXB46926.1 hypothetical protein A4R43_34475 [Amycolatopsis albispora]